MFIKILKKLVLIGLGMLLILVSLAIVAISIMYPKLPSMTELKNYKPKLPLQVYSEDNVLLGEFGTEHRIFLSIKKTPPMLINAIISAEDERFYQHSGVDFLSILRATLGNLLTGHLQSGGSTITMQVARNFFLSTEKTFSRKFKEMLLSYKIESTLSKDEIMSLYINQIFLGQRSYGFAEAANTYFGRPVNKLSIAEYAVLAGLPKAPSAYNPVNNPKRARSRELYVLERMYKHGFITESQYNQAVNQKIIVMKGSDNDSNNFGAYVAEMVRQYLYPTYGDKIYTAGFKVFTTINSKMQKAAYIALREGLMDYDLKYQGYKGPESMATIESDDSTEAIASNLDTIPDYGNLLAAVVISTNPNHVIALLRNGNSISLDKTSVELANTFNASNTVKIKRGAIIRVKQINGSWILTQVPQVEGGIVAVNPQDGAIKALIGGFDFAKGSFNHIVQAKRQPGSSIKPFIYYAAFEKGYTPESSVVDQPVCYLAGNGDNWCPKNSDGKFLGEITVAQALAKSRDTVIVQLLDKIGVKFAIEELGKFGFDTEDMLPYLTLALGAQEVTPLELDKAFSVLANGGYAIQPYFITKIVDSKGRLVAQTQPIDINKQEPVVNPSNVYAIDKVLQGTIQYGTAARVYQELKRPDLAGKTGTANDSKDVWFTAFNPNLVSTVWVGYDQPKSLGKKIFGANLPLPIWLNFIKPVIEYMPVADFKPVDYNKTDTSNSKDGASTPVSEQPNKVAQQVAQPILNKNVSSSPTSVNKTSASQAKAELKQESKTDQKIIAPKEIKLISSAPIAIESTVTSVHTIVKPQIESHAEEKSSETKSESGNAYD
jgi:penicillin-binding protein 1A